VDARQREELMFEVRNRVMHLEIFMKEVVRILERVVGDSVRLDMVLNELMRIMGRLAEERELYERVLELLERLEVEEVKK
jgi:hypothetical protein